MNNNVAFGGKIECIQVLRVFAALGIAAFHITFIADTGLYLEFGVHLFFLISAFLIMYTTQKKVVEGFLRKRLVRLIPLYWLMTIATFLAAKIIPSFADGTIGTAELVKSLLFIPYFRDGMKGTGVIRPIVGPAWTLYYEIYLSVLFAILLQITKKYERFYKYRGAFTVGVCVVLAIIGKLYAFQTPFLRVITTDYVLDFAAGVVAFELLKRIYHKNFAVWQRTVWVAVAGVCVLLIVVVDFPLFAIIWRMLLSFVIFVFFVVGMKNIKMPKYLVTFGDMSYSFYMLHYYVIIIAEKIFNLEVFSIQALTGVIAIFIINTVGAFISWKFIEVDLGNYLKKIFLRSVYKEATQ